MKYIKLFEYYQDIDAICDKYDIINYTVNNDGLVDVDGNVKLTYVGLLNIPLNFGTVNGYFFCSGNKLTSLEGAPKNVEHDFSCSFNKLTSLEGAPKDVGYSFDCRDNQLTSLKGCPENIGSDFYCQNNKLATLKYFPKVNGEIRIDRNPLPVEIKNNKRYFNKIVKLQDEYQIWNYNDTLNLPRFELMMDEIKSNK